MCSSLLKGGKISKWKCPEDNCRHVTEAHQKASLEKKYGVSYVATIAELSLNESV